MIWESILKINFLLNKKQKLQLIFLSLLLLLGMFLEALGFGIILPFLEVISISNINEYPYYIISFRDFLNIKSQNELILAILLLLVTIYLIKTFFLIFINYFQNIFLANLNISLTSKLFKIYLNQPYSFFLNENSADIYKHLLINTNHFESFCSSILAILSEAGLLLTILISVFIIEPMGTISMGLLLILFSGVYYILTKLKIKSWGNSREMLEKKLNKLTLESLKGIKTLMIFKKTDIYRNKFDDTKRSLQRLKANYKTLSIIPRYYLELVAIFILAFYICLIIYSEKNITSVIATLGVFLAAILKLIPSTNKIILGLQNLKFVNSSIDLLYNEFKLPFNESQNQLDNKKSFNPLKKITFKSLRFRYNNTQKNILNNIDFEIYNGEIVGIMGRSGEGKSTLIDLLVGLIEPINGDILINDKQSIFDNTQNWREQIGYISQDIFLFDSTIRENIAFGLSPDLIDNDLLKKSIIGANLKSHIDSLPNGVETLVGESGVRLSGGQIQRIGIARALYRQPMILLLDEATSSLDEKTEQEIMKTISLLKGKKTIIIISHQLKTLKDCSKIYELKDGVMNLMSL